MISIVIVNWNSGHLLEKCVRSLRENAPDCQILVVDNASTDSSARLNVKADITVFHNESNLGFAAACNRGWREARGEQILFLNPDTECFPGSIECLEQTLQADDSIWAVGGCLVAPDGTPQIDLNFRPFPTITRVAAEMFLLDEILRARSRNHPSEIVQSDTALDVEQPAAACLMTSKSVLETMEGFDENFYPAWFEDVDFCRRIHKGGGRIQYQPRARFLHQGGYSLNNMNRKDFLKYFHTNQIRYFRKHRGLPAALYVQKLVVSGLLLRSGISLIHPLVPHTSRAESAGIFWKALCSIATCKEAWA
jgi:N-acetylglucosaminyl-diphospho-decaprenol L-rhamnosyltransferase